MPIWFLPFPWVNKLAAKLVVIFQVLSAESGKNPGQCDEN